MVLVFGICWALHWIASPYTMEQGAFYEANSHLAIQKIHRLP
jgi:hypothetical protein